MTLNEVRFGIAIFSAGILAVLSLVLSFYLFDPVIVAVRPWDDVFAYPVLAIILGLIFGFAGATWWYSLKLLIKVLCVNERSL